MNKTYDLAMRFRIVGIAISILSIVLLVVRPFDPVLSVGMVYLFMIISALLIIIGQLIVIKLVPDEEFVTQEQRRESLYDVITTGIVVLIFIGVYVVPFMFKYIF